MDVNEKLLGQIRQYLSSQASSGDREAINLLQELFTVLAKSELARNLTAAEFSDQLFKTWQSIANEQVGDNFWSYPIPLEDISQSLEISIEHLCEHLAAATIPSLQLISGRGHNYQVGQVSVAALTFHQDSNAGTPTTTKAKQTKKQNSGASIAVEFALGDRVRVTAKRPQYANQTGTVDQIISVSCRVKLDNGWMAFLPKDCLEKF